MAALNIFYFFMFWKVGGGGHLVNLLLLYFLHEEKRLIVIKKPMTILILTQIHFSTIWNKTDCHKDYLPVLKAVYKNFLHLLAMKFEFGKLNCLLHSH